MESKVELPGTPAFLHIKENQFSGQKIKKLKDEDISICECKYDPSDPQSACGERCLNVLTSTECTPGYCPCRDFCKNQKFQKCEYAKTKLFKTEGRGWGLQADEDIKAGSFIIEYCGELISSEEARGRSDKYEIEGRKDSYIISLNANYFIDATTMGSFARFINHSCQPNCETRKWTVLGKTRVGIFAKYDISVGTELAYDYNFEWYGGATVRCLCGAANCSIFLGAKSHGFQDYYHVWEDGDDRYTVDEIPLYDSAEDEQFLGERIINPDSAGGSSSLIMGSSFGPISDLDHAVTNKVQTMVPEEGLDVSVKREELDSAQPPLEGFMVPVKRRVGKETELHPEQELQQTFPHAMISRIRSNTAARNYNIGPGPGSSSRKKSQSVPKKKGKLSGRKQSSSSNGFRISFSEEAQVEIKKYEDIKNQAASNLSAVYEEIRPAVEEHDRDNQENVDVKEAEKWIEAMCGNLKAQFNFHHSVIMNVMCPAQTAKAEVKGNELLGEDSKT